MTNLPCVSPGMFFTIKRLALMPHMYEKGWPLFWHMSLCFSWNVCPPCVSDSFRPCETMKISDRLIVHSRRMWPILFPSATHPYRTSFLRPNRRTLALSPPRYNLLRCGPPKSCKINWAKWFKRSAVSPDHAKALIMRPSRQLHHIVWCDFS